MDNELLHKIKQLEDELNETKQHLKKYTEKAKMEEPKNENI